MVSCFLFGFLQLENDKNEFKTVKPVRETKPKLKIFLLINK